MGLRTAEELEAFDKDEALYSLKRAHDEEVTFLNERAAETARLQAEKRDKTNRALRRAVDAGVPKSYIALAVFGTKKRNVVYDRVQELASAEIDAIIYDGVVPAGAPRTVNEVD